MQHAHGTQGGNLFLAFVIILAGAAIGGSWNAVKEDRRSNEPRKLITLGQALGSCGTRSFDSGLKMVGCSDNTRGERRGGGVFMKPPR